MEAGNMVVVAVRAMLMRRNSTRVKNMIMVSKENTDMDKEDREKGKGEERYTAVIGLAVTALDLAVVLITED